MSSWGQKFALVGAICLVPATWAIYQYGIIGMPSILRTISETQGEEYTGKFGNDFKTEFISAINPDNKDWWQKIYQERYPKENSSNLSTAFQNIQIPYDLTDNDSNKGLNEVCKEAYGKELRTDFLPDEDSNGSKKKYLKDVIRFCSLSGEQPKTIADTSVSTSQKIKDKYGNQLLSALPLNNQLIWKILEKAFFKTENTDYWGKTAKDTTAGFKTLYEKTNRGTEDTLPNTCKKAYEMDSDTTKDKEVKAFCSL